VLRAGRLRPIAEGSFLGFPLSLPALAASSLFSWRGKLRMACEAVIPRGGADEESIAAFVRRRFGAEAADYLAEPLLAGIHAGDAERLSLAALFPQLRDAERRAGSVLRAARTLRMAPSARGAFVSLPGGMGELVEAVAAALGGSATVRLSTRASEVRRAGVFSVDTDSGPVAARAVVLAVPAWSAAGLLRAIDGTLAQLCDAVPYASTATVALGYRRDQIRHPLAGSGFVVPRVEQTPLLAATWVTSKWPGRAPDGHVLLRGYLGGGRDPGRLEQSDGELVATVQRALSGILHIDDAPLFSRLFRFARQSPQYELGHLQRVAAIDARAAAIPGLFLTGSGVRAIGIPDCIADGRATAARVAAFLGA
jgi:oxygen-dependent protoporphyrinogen oxidase